MYAFNIREKDDEKQIESVFDSYKNDFNNMIYSNIIYKISKKNNYLQLLKLNIPVFQLKKAVCFYNVTAI